MGAIHRADVDYDVIVVGAGPAGAVAARTAAERSARVLLLEGRREIGRPVQCTGLLSVRGVELSGASPEVIVRGIRGAFVYGPDPDGKRLALEKDDVHAYVIDRDRFDLDLVERAVRAGVEVRLKSPAVGLERSEANRVQTLRVKTNGHEVRLRARVVVGADGPRSVVARAAGLPPPEKTIIGVQATIAYEPPREDYVEVWLSHAIAPNFFAWAVPAAPGTARVGLGTDDPKQAKALFDRWVARQFPDCEILGFQSGSIPIGPSSRTVTDGVLLVGDAAGQAKPTSGGGIYTGISCARIAGEVAAKAALSGDASERTLGEYERRWREAFEGELRLGLVAHRIYGRLRDPEIARLLEAASDPRIVQVLSEHGDIDYPGRVVRRVMESPALLAKLLQAAPRRMEIYLPLLQEHL